MKHLLFLFVLITTNALYSMELEETSHKFVRVYKIAVPNQKVGRFVVVDDEFSPPSTDVQAESILKKETETNASDDQAIKQPYEFLSKLFIVFRNLVAI